MTCADEATKFVANRRRSILLSADLCWLIYTHISRQAS